MIQRRSLLKLILLSFVTLGIYRLYSGISMQMM